MYAYTLVLSCSSLITSSIYRIFVEYWCAFSDRPISTQSDLRPSAGHLGWSYSVYSVICPTISVNLEPIYGLYRHVRGGGQGGRSLPPPTPLSPSSLLERRALRARKFSLPPFFSPLSLLPPPLLPPPTPSSPSSLPLFSLLPPLHLPPPAPSSPTSLLPCPPPHVTAPSPASQRKYTHERFRLWSRLRSIEYYSPFQRKACLERHL